MDHERIPITSILRTPKRLLATLVVVLSVVLLGATADAGGDWRALAEGDMRAAARAVGDEYIYAIYPDPGIFQRVLDERLRASLGELRLVSDEAGYRAALQHFVVASTNARPSSTSTIKPPPKYRPCRSTR